jgi:succinoglycan biosynthesis transport protein ExoP
MNNDQLNQQLNLNKLLKISFERKWLIICCLLAELLPAIIYNRLSRPLYKADTTVLFKNEDAQIMQPPKDNRVPENVNNQIEVVKSRAIAEEVVKSLPQWIIDDYPLPENKTRDFNMIEYIAKQIRDRISSHAVPNSDVIRIEVEAYSPEAAKIIADLIAEVYKKKKLESRKEETRNDKNIIEEQLAIYKTKSDNADKDLKEFKEQNKVTDIDKKADEIIRSYTAATVDYNQNRVELNAAEKRLAFIENKYANESQHLEQIFEQAGIYNIQPLLLHLDELEKSLSILLSRGYNDKHPEILRLKREIQQIRDQLKKDAPDESIENVLAHIQRLKEQKDELEIDIQTYRARENTLRSIINYHEKNLNALPEQEIQLARLIRERKVNETMYGYLLQKREEMRITNAEIAGNVVIIDPAKINSFPIKPRKTLNIIVAVVLGLTMGTGIAFLMEISDNSIKSANEAEHLSGLNVLATVPQISNKIKKVIVEHLAQKTGRKVSERIPNLVTVFRPKSPESEAFRVIRTKLQLLSIGSSLKTIIITSPNPSEGKSVITANLGIASAQMGQKTLLVDADVRRPTLHPLFNKKREPGLVNVLLSIEKLNNNGKFSDLDDGHRTIEKKHKNLSDGYLQDKSTINFEQILTSINLNDYYNKKMNSLIRNTITSTYIENLDFLPCGSIPGDPSIITGSNAMKKLVFELRNLYDVVFIDTLPINIFPDVALLGTMVDGSIIVTKAKRTSIEDLFEAKELLKKAQSEILGLVLNCLNRNNGYTKYYDYYS